MSAYGANGGALSPAPGVPCCRRFRSSEWARKPTSTILPESGPDSANFGGDFDRLGKVRPALRIRRGLTHTGQNLADVGGRRVKIPPKLLIAPSNDVRVISKRPSSIRQWSAFREPSPAPSPPSPVCAERITELRDIIESSNICPSLPLRASALIVPGGDGKCDVNQKNMTCSS